jgi:TetR/AcrR family transcriptional regulator
MRSASSSRDRLLAAAALEFAARGFDGAKVDRIAARARLNKAMLYYHFKNKAALYREILRDLFQSIAAVTAEVREAGGDPETQLRGFIHAVAGEASRHPHFPPIWLREMAEGGRHLDASIIAEMRGIIGTLAGILGDGERAGRFKSANPFVVQIGIVSPLLMFAASRPLRERFARVVPSSVATSSPSAVVEQVEASTLASLSVGHRAGRRALPLSSRRTQS